MKIILIIKKNEETERQIWNKSHLKVPFFSIRQCKNSNCAVVKNGSKIDIYSVGRFDRQYTVSIVNGHGFDL